MRHLCGVLVVQWVRKRPLGARQRSTRGLTHSLDYGKEGLAVHATRLKARADHPVNGDKVLFDICVSCGTMFSNKSYVHGNYCSKTCRRSAKALEKQGIEATPENVAVFLRQRKCATCKKPLDIGLSMRAKYCSAKCRRAVVRPSGQKARYIKLEAAKSAIERDDWRCYLCGKFIDPTAPLYHPTSLNIDHLIPVIPAAGSSLRGTGVLVNIAVTHRKCNSKKKNKIVKESLEKLGENIAYHGRSNVTRRYIRIYRQYLKGEIPCTEFDLL